MAGAAPAFVSDDTRENSSSLKSTSFAERSAELRRRADRNRHTQRETAEICTERTDEP